MRIERKLNTPSRANFWKIAGMLSLVYLLVRLPGLMSLPIFGDEAIYLRWAQLIRGEGISSQSGPVGAVGHHWWVSLADPKPPLHFWILALFFRLSKDPLVMARLISVLAGLIWVPLMMAAGREFSVFLVPGKRKFPAHLVGVIAVVLGIFCPFLAFYQRLATADALFVAESVLIVWLSFRWARSVCVAGNRWGSWLNALWLALAVGSALMTRQGLSYTICIMPPLALLMHFYGVPRVRVDPTLAVPLER
ncbi:MAG TPA: glycosyltransferase family 39 protein, partial [Phycisphaerae bacterium]